MFSKLSIFNIQNENSNLAWHWPTFCGVQSFCSSTMFGIVVDEHVIRHSQKISLHTWGKWCDHLKNQIFNFGALFQLLKSWKIISWNRWGRTIPIKVEEWNKLGPMEANVKHTLAQRPISNSKSNSDFVPWILKV